MLDAKKRNLYIGLISVSLIGTILVWFFGFGSSGSVAPDANQPASAVPAVNIPPTTGATKVSLPKDGEFPMPGIFPATLDYDFSVLESSVYKNLKDYQSLTVDEKDLGREDPFKLVE